MIHSLEYAPGGNERTTARGQQRRRRARRLVRDDEIERTNDQLRLRLIPDYPMGSGSPRVCDGAGSRMTRAEAFWAFCRASSECRRAIKGSLPLAGQLVSGLRRVRGRSMLTADAASLCVARYGGGGSGSGSSSSSSSSSSSAR
jgi:hypothetical protein